MAVMDGESEMTKIWGVVVELSDQLTRMRQYASQLHNQSIKVKVCNSSRYEELSVNPFNSKVCCFKF